MRRFGPQKGLAAEEAARVEADARRFADLVEDAFGRHVRALPGAGAAGGLGWALALLGAELVPGAPFVLGALDFAARCRDADWVVVAEGRADLQTLQGKAPWHAARIARRRHARVALVAAEVRDRQALAPHFDLVCDLREAGVPLAEGLARPAGALARLGRFLGGRLRRA